MMDVPTANQSRTPYQQWAGQHGWCTASPPGSLCSPVPGFQHLCLGSPSDQRSRHFHQLPASNHGRNAPTGTDAHRNTACDENAAQRLQHITPDAQVPPCSLPLDEGTQPRHPRQMSSPYSPRGPQPATSAPSLLLPPYAHHGSPSGPQPPPPPPHQNHLPLSPPSFGQCANQSAQFTPQANTRHDPASPSTSPVQQQSRWAPPPPPHPRGAMNEFVPGATARGVSIVPPQSPNSESRYGLDPELLPSAVKVIAEDRAEWEGKVFVSEPFSRLPPLATTSCIIEDRGNASPLAIRATSYCVPCEGQTALLSRLPLGALVTPLARGNPGEKPLPVCKEPECVSGCSGCGASMCAAMGWQDCGQRFYCPFCGKLGEVPWQHYQPTYGAEGARVDKDKRPELSMGSYEILGSQKGEPAALLLAIDVSASALRGGHLEFVTEQIHSLLTSLNRQDGDAPSDVRVGLMTYDGRIHLYDLSPALSRPHMLVITETDDLQLPVREGLLVSLRDCMDSIDSVLRLIPQFSAECDDSGGVPAELPVKAALAILQALSCPGKLLIFHTASLMEMGHANSPSSSGFFGSSKPKSIFQPSEPAVSLAQECVRQGCGVHLFVLSQQDVGGAWPGHIPYLTGGALHTYGHLQGELDKERFSADLKRTVETDTGYKAELRIFVSSDLRVSGCYGLFLPGPSPALVALATLDRRTTLAVELSHTRGLDETRGAAIQTALTYSTRTGDRRTRVHTLTLRCSRHLQDAFRHCQAQTLLTFYCKKMYCAVLERPLQEMREELQMEVTEALASYRKHCSSASVSAGQLVLPQYLRALPVYTNSLRKSEVLLPGLRSSIHRRLQQRCQVLGMDTPGTAAHFYPLLLPLPLSVENSEPPNPEQALRCCAVSLEPRGLYLVHTPLTLLLWVGTRVPASTLVELFNTSCFSSLPSGETKLPVLENPLSVSVRSLIDGLNSQGPCARKLWLVKEGDACEEALQHHLVEDKSPNGGASYADFLYHLHINSVRLLQ
uniref:Protein transport protein Sec24C-like n=1 Tax=Scophthalmus maximus TaxID=52904 RepID=A0A8D3AMA2_SCOMX